MTTPPPPFINPPMSPTVATLTVRYTYSGQPVVNVLGLVNDPAGAAGGAIADQVVANAALSGWWNNVRANLSDQLVLQGATLRGGSVATPLVFEAAVPAATTGSLVGQHTSPAFAAVMRLSSTRAGRRGTGRLYIPGVVETYLGANRQDWVPGSIALLKDRVVTYSIGTYGGMKPAVVSRRQGLAYPITGVVARTKVGVQRNRLYA